MLASCIGQLAVTEGQTFSNGCDFGLGLIKFVSCLRSQSLAVVRKLMGRFNFALP